MLLKLVLSAFFVVCQSKILTVHSKYRQQKAPLTLNSGFKPSESVQNRQKRDLWDDHNSDYASLIKTNQSVLVGDNHGTAFVEWGGSTKGSDTIVVLTRDSTKVPSDSTLYVSTDYGKSFKTESPMVNGVAAVCSYIYQSPVNHRQFMLNDIVNNAVVVSTDEGRTWQTYKTEFAPTYIDHHPSVELLSLGYDSSTKKLFLTRDFGKSWTALMPEKNIRDIYWGDTNYDDMNTIFVTAEKADGNLEVWSSKDFFVNKKLREDDVIEFELVKEFYFAVKKSTHTDRGSGDLDLYISYDRSSAVKAQFPPAVDKNPTQEFFIADAGLGQAFVAVSHADNVTNLYVSEHKGSRMMLSLERVLFTNAASFDQIAWLNGVEPFTDFEEIKGLPGVFIASQLDGGAVGHRRIHTVMTFNKGGTWQRLQPPLYDMDGNPLECYLPDCSLHLSLTFGVKYPYSKQTPLLSKANAPGYILASGNHGEASSTFQHVYMSNDGGVEWFQVLKGKYNFQFADHGGIAVAASRDPTTIIMYSHDEGMHWYNKTISDKPLLIYGLVTEPGEATSVFNVYATVATNLQMEWTIISIDFKDFLGRHCVQGDFMKWSIRDELKNTECVLGTDTQFERKKPTSHCYIGLNYNRTVSALPCPCQASDFECDFLYERENAGDPCIFMVPSSMESWFIPDDCPPGGTYPKTMGYVKIEGDKCEGGEEALFSYQDTPCPDEALNNLTIAVSPGYAVQLGTPVTLTAKFGLTNRFIFLDDVFFLWHFSNGESRSGTGNNMTQLVYTFDQPGTYTVSLTTSNGAGPVVAMTVVEVDVPVTGVQMSFSPHDPAIDEAMIFIISKTDASRELDSSRLNFNWSVGGSTGIPVLLWTFPSPGRQEISCNVTNSISWKVLTVNFDVSDLTITSLDGIPVDSRSVQVAWLPPSTRPGLVSAYTLKYKNSMTDSTWHQIALPVNATSYRIKNLEPNALYDISVVTTSAGGATSEQSQIINATTLPLNTRDPPLSILTNANGNEVQVSWQKGNENPNSYNVEYWMNDRPSTVMAQSTGSKSTSVKLTDLTAGALYSIRVSAVYDGGIASYAGVVDVRVEGVTPEEVGNPLGFPLNDTAVVLVWDTPTKDNAPEGYRVTNATNNELIATTSLTTFTVAHLQPYTQYLFTLTPYSGTRTGSRSDVIRVTTDYGIPGPVEELSCMMRGSDTVLTWHPPSLANGPIREFLISYTDDDLKDLKIPTTVEPDTHSISIPNLPLYKMFRFSVQVQGPELRSPLSYTTCAVTSANGVPGPPTMLYLKQVELSSIEIMWRSPPVDSDATDLGYEVKYGVYRDSTWIGQQQILNTTQLFARLTLGISPSTEYGITVSAYNTKGTGPPTAVLIASTPTPVIGSVEYEIKFARADVEKYGYENDMESFGEAIKEEIVSLTAVARSRLSGFGITHQDATDVNVVIWIAPRDMSDTTVPSTEHIVSKLDSAIKDNKFVVGNMRARSGKIEQTQRQTASHHDIAEIIIPGVCGLLMVGLIAGLLYYRNRYQNLLRRYRFTSRYNPDNDDVNMIECADETDGISSSDLQGGSLSISNDPELIRHQQQGTSGGIRNFFNFKRSNYAPLDQTEPDEILDDDEEHLLPL